MFMKEKVLRSQIHENFPLECRVELNMLSKRRDLTDQEKQNELFNIIRKYKINATPLGAGTNRYAFKLNGYAVKFAYNTDGKIDNFKEFKMSPILQPNVIQCYEVSEDGILLITEYIRPFSSFIEMTRYEDEIKKILNGLSQRYMFGDVGIVSKNFANWGTRIGYNQPVCLDFAYVYEVSSNLFACRKCKANAMMIPTDNYAQLKCPSCGSVSNFEEIRQKLGNDLHRHEIGNLRDVGYLMDRSNVLTTLDPIRSPYLDQEEFIDDRKCVEEEEEIKDTFCYHG